MAKEDVLQNVEILVLGIDYAQIEEIVSLIIDLTESRLKAILNVDEIPSELEYIVTEVSIIRYNRIGSEGLDTQTVEGESLAFNDDDFDKFKKEIFEWKKKQNQVLGMVTFL